MRVTEPWNGKRDEKQGDDGHETQLTISNHIFITASLSKKAFANCVETCVYFLWVFSAVDFRTESPK